MVVGGDFLAGMAKAFRYGNIPKMISRSLRDGDIILGENRLAIQRESHGLVDLQGPAGGIGRGNGGLVGPALPVGEERVERAIVPRLTPLLLPQGGRSAREGGG